ncbi:MAG: hypothetical protein KJ077_06895 [Anaerolineae bacterium]|nr:hypothetical protein [Anaerolineae bacterium]
MLSYFTKQGAKSCGTALSFGQPFIAVVLLLAIRRVGRADGSNLPM